MLLFYLSERYFFLCKMVQDINPSSPVDVAFEELFEGWYRKVNNKTNSCLKATKLIQDWCIHFK